MCCWARSMIGSPIRKYGTPFRQIRPQGFEIETFHLRIDRGNANLEAHRGVTFADAAGCAAATANPCRRQAQQHAVAGLDHAVIGDRPPTSRSRISAVLAA